MAKHAKSDQIARKLAVAAARVAHDNNAEDITILDLRGVSPVTDYFLICTGTSDRQIRALAEHIEEHGKSMGQPVWRVAGKDKADWVLLDFVDVVVHLFAESRRKHYDLELIWGEVPRVRWQRGGSARKGASP